MPCPLKAPFPNENDGYSCLWVLCDKVYLQSCVTIGFSTVELNPSCQVILELIDLFIKSNLDIFSIFLVNSIPLNIKLYFYLSFFRLSTGSSEACFSPVYCSFCFYNFKSLKPVFSKALKPVFLFYFLLLNKTFDC